MFSSAASFTLDLNTARFLSRMVIAMLSMSMLSLRRRLDDKSGQLDRSCLKARPRRRTRRMRSFVRACLVEGCKRFWPGKNWRGVYLREKILLLISRAVFVIRLELVVKIKLFTQYVLSCATIHR